MLVDFRTLVIHNMTKKKLIILGGGESGVGAALLGKAKGYDVFLSDKGSLKEEYRKQLQLHGIDFEEGKHDEERILQAHEVVKSPGIPDQVALIQGLRRKDIPVISEIEFAARYTAAKLIAITGSNGKTTTSLLTYHLLKHAGLSVGLAGNIGKSFALQVLENEFDYYVLEISSFQLDNMYRFRAAISVLLNITPDHLDRYGYRFENYVDSKFRIIQNQTENDNFIYFLDSDVIGKELQKKTLAMKQWPVSLVKELEHGAYLQDGALHICTDAQEFLVPTSQLPVQGPHNAINAMSALLVARLVGIGQAALQEGLKTFKNAPHRLEPVATVNGVTFVNDSKATNVDSVFYALNSFERPIILIAGGVDKGNEYDQIRELVVSKVKGFIALGTDNQKLESYFAPLVKVFYSTESVQEAVNKAAEWGVEGDVVLLSPACASFDLFKNYEDRGEKFKQAVATLNEGLAPNHNR